MDTISMPENSKSTEECLKNQHLEDAAEKNNTIEDFSWLSKFSRIIRSSIGSRNYRHLERSLLLYTQNVLSSITASNIKFNDAINMKNHISNMLIFFHLYWLDIKQDIADHNSYLNRISTLLNVYIDIELKTSTDKRSSSYVRDSSKVAAKILAALYIYLNNSQEHIFRVLLRIKHATKKYTKICDHLFMKSFTNLTKITSMTDVAYVRYLLAFKMWKKIEEDFDRKGRINKLALMLLGSRMPKLRDELLEFVPRPPASQENETLWLLQSNLFDLKQAHKHFLLFEDKLDNTAGLQCDKTNSDQSFSQKLQTSPLSSQNNSNRGVTDHDANKDHLDASRSSHNEKKGVNGNKSTDQTYLQTKRIRRLKLLKKMRKKSGKTIIIDLTGDDEVNVPYKKVEKKKVKRNLEYLKIMKKKHKSQKYTDHLKNSNRSVDAADAQVCSNEDTKTLSNDKVRFESSPMTCAIGNVANSYGNPMMQNKEALTSQEDSAMETMPLLKTCQSNIADQHSFKQELPSSTNCNAMQKSHKCCDTVPVDMHDIKHLIIKKLKSINDHSSQITEIIKQKVCHRVNECSNCCTKVDCKPLVFTNNNIAVAKDASHSIFNQNENDIKSTCDTNIIYMLIDRNKRVYFLNHIGECVMTAHAEKGAQCLNKSNDTCTVSTTFTGDEAAESPLYNQHVNLDNIRTNDYGNAIKYSDITMKEQQRRSNYDISLPNDGLHSLEPCTFDINSFENGSNVEVDYKSQLKNFPKAEEANKISKTIDCLKDFENIGFLNIQNETLGKFFRQSSVMSQVNCDNTVGAPMKKSFAYTNNDVTAVNPQDDLHNMFDDNENDVKSNIYNTNVIYMLSNRDKCVYVANQTDECVSAAVNAEKSAQCLDNPNDMCTVSTTFIEDQIMESQLDSQHVDFNNMKSSDYENGSKYFEDNKMKEVQNGTNCDTSIPNDQLHSTESCTFDINSFEIDSKEANEIMKTDCTDDFENIRFLHNIESLEEILENVLHQPSLMSQINCDSSNGGSKDFKENLFSVSDDITDILSSKHSSFEVDNMYCNVLSDVPSFEDDQGLQSSAQHEFFFAEGDRRVISPKQYEKVSWTQDTSWCQPSCSWCWV